MKPSNRCQGLQSDIDPSIEDESTTLTIALITSSKSSSTSEDYKHRKKEKLDITQINLQELNEMTQEVVSLNRAELRSINQKISALATKLVSHHQKELEYQNYELKKRVKNVVDENDECY